MEIKTSIPSEVAEQFNSQEKLVVKTKIFISGSRDNSLSSYHGPRKTYRVSSLDLNILSKILQFALSLTELGPALDRSKFSLE